jgi:hypothetical protein
MAIEFKSYESTGEFGEYNNGWTIDKPVGTVEGDVLLLVLQKENVDDITTVPFGFIFVGEFLVVSTERVHVYAKRCGASEPDDYRIEWTDLNIFTLFLGCFSGVIESGDIFDTSASIASLQPFDVIGTVPSITTVTSNTMLIAIVGTQPANAIDLPDFVELFDSVGSSVHYAYQSVPEPSGEKFFDIVNYGSDYGSMMLALRSSDQTTEKHFNVFLSSSGNSRNFAYKDLSTNKFRTFRFR